MTIERQLTLMEVEAFAANFEYELHRFILPHFRKCIEKYENLDMNLMKALVEFPFTTMAITKNLISILHLDKGYSKISYIMWFHKSKFVNPSKVEDHTEERNSCSQITHCFSSHNMERS
jgi:hypothetical protein